MPLPVGSVLDGGLPTFLGITMVLQFGVNLYILELKIQFYDNSSLQYNTTTHLINEIHAILFVCIPLYLQGMHTFLLY